MDDDVKAALANMQVALDASNTRIAALENKPAPKPGMTADEQAAVEQHYSDLAERVAKLEAAPADGLTAAEKATLAAAERIHATYFPGEKAGA